MLNNTSFPHADNDSAVEGFDSKLAADRIMGRVIPLGQRFYPSESAFPLRKSPSGQPMRALAKTLRIRCRTYRVAFGSLCSRSQGRATLRMGSAYSDPVWGAIPGSLGYLA